MVVWWMEDGWMVDDAWMDGWVDDGWWMDGESVVQVGESYVARAGHLEEGRKRFPVRPTTDKASAALGAGSHVSPVRWALVVTSPPRT